MKVEQKKSSLVTSGDGGILRFPTGSAGDFSRLRMTKGAAYFDRTKFISIVEQTSSLAMLFLRPRGFGKSLNLSMLECFHDVNQKGKYALLFKVWLLCDPDMH